MQSDLENIKISIKNAAINHFISDIIVLDFPKWSIYYRDGTILNSFDLNMTFASSIHKYLRENFM